MMNKTVAALFAEHAKPTHASRADVHAAIAPVARMVADVRKQLIEYRALATDMQLAADSTPELAGKFEHFQQTFRSLEREAEQAEVALRRLAASMAQLDRYVDDAKATLSK